ncbi:MAG: sulfite exporter TauE/SafE family protein [Dehalococcoidales bacterium]|nr:sulfite exporter TauE/SafE family protein [Dehalococcoidales bacterium]
MAYVVISITALVVSALTLFSGFGLGTILMPAFALFFPIQVAIAATAVVHLANNIFKVTLVGRKANWGVVLKFALPAALAAILGAWLLNLLSETQALTTYQIGNRVQEITLIKLVIGILIIIFALLELIPRMQKMSFDKKYLPVGGVLSGFFGGLSGNQGALRSAFLLKTGLDKEAFVGTNAVSGFIVDIVRVIVYSASFYTSNFALITGDLRLLVLIAIVFAFIGSFFGARLVKKVTFTAIQYIVGIMLLVVGAGLAAGLL